MCVLYKKLCVYYIRNKVYARYISYKTALRKVKVTY